MTIIEEAVKYTKESDYYNLDISAEEWLYNFCAHLSSLYTLTPKGEKAAGTTHQCTKEECGDKDCPYNHKPQENAETSSVSVPQPMTGHWPESCPACQRDVREKPVGWEMNEIGKQDHFCGDNLTSSCCDAKIEFRKNACWCSKCLKRLHGNPRKATPQEQRIEIWHDVRQDGLSQLRDADVINRNLITIGKLIAEMKELLAHTNRLQQ